MAKKSLNGNIGVLAIYSAEGKTIRESITDLQDKANQYSVPLFLLPRPQSKQGAFERATTYVQDTMTVEQPVVCKEILNDVGRIVRVFEKRKLTDVSDVSIAFEGKKIIPIWEHVATMTFFKDTQTINTTVIKPCGRAIIKKSMDRYAELADFYDITRIRAMIANAFQYYEGIQFRRNGGVTFIPQAQVDEFTNFVSMCDSIEGVQLDMYDLNFSEGNKDKVLNNFRIHVSETFEEEIKALNGKTVGSKALDELVAEFATALKEKGTLRNDKVQRLVGQFKDVQQLTKTYQDLLQVNLEDIADKIEIAKKQVVALLDKAEE